MCDMTCPFLWVSTAFDGLHSRPVIVSLVKTPEGLCESMSPGLMLSQHTVTKKIEQCCLPYSTLGGAEGTRTPDPLHAMQMRYQLRHSPKLLPQLALTRLDNVDYLKP